MRCSSESEQLKLNGKIVSPEELVRTLRRENPRQLSEYSWHSEVNALLTDWERMSESQKWMFPGG